MIASKISFSRETQEKLNYRPLSPKHKSLLRRERVKEYIRSVPNGEARRSDLIYAAGYDASKNGSYKSGYVFIRALEKKGIIASEEGPPGKKLLRKWSIPSDAMVKTKPQPNVMNVVPPRPKESWHWSELEESAKQFAWETGSDSLREYVKTMRTWGGK